MSESTGIVKSVIKSYNDSRIGIIKRFTDHEEEFLDENGFLDDGYITSKINRLKKAHDKHKDELERIMKYENISDTAIKKKVAGLIEEQRQLRRQIAFLASNSFDSIESCMKMLEDTDTDLRSCLEALKSYGSGAKSSAFLQLHDCLKNRKDPIEHFLINKVYGEFLYKNRQFESAIPILRKAAEKRPEDIELHKMLKGAYDNTGLVVESEIEESIIELLSDDKNPSSDD